MRTTTLMAAPGEHAHVVDLHASPPADGWLWIDIDLDEGEASDELEQVVAHLGLDPLSMYDAGADEDAPKLDDFDDHLLVVLHGLSAGKVETYEIHCFLTSSVLVTVHRDPSSSIDALAGQLEHSVDLASGGPDQLLGRLADVVSRRYLGLVGLLDHRLDELTDMALEADPNFLEELTVLRREAAEIRGVLRPQRDVFERLRSSQSPVLTVEGRRRFSDVYDTVQHCVRELEAARRGLADALGAYQGAEAREATEVTKVLTIYAAIMFPLSLIAGVWGMNFRQLPAADSPKGFTIILILMGVIAVGSLAVFAAVGWIRPPSPRGAGSLIGRGLVEATRAPVHLVGALTRRRSHPTGTAPRASGADPAAPDRH